MKPYGGTQEPAGVMGFIVLNLFNFISINVFLALFNLLPIPPFDGSHIVEGLLPEQAARSYAKFRQVGMLIPILLIIVLPQLIPGFSVTRYLIAPVDWVITWYVKLSALVAGV
jgi:Zn-dependent protease